MEELPGPFIHQKVGRIVTAENAFDRVIVLGLYAGGAFDGTDRLAMNVQREWEGYLKFVVTRNRYQSWGIIFEGDRLFNRPTLDLLAHLPCRTLLLCLWASPGAKSFRHSIRNDAQGSAFLKGRETKYLTLLRRFPIKFLKAVRHETPQDTHRLVGEIKKFLSAAS